MDKWQEKKAPHVTGKTGFILVHQERGLSLYEDQEPKDDGEDGESSTISLRDAISLAVPDETSSGMNLMSS